jgi:transposase
MTTSISLSPPERNTLLRFYRAPFHDPGVRLRAHILLLLDAGHPWATITAVLFCSSRTIARWKARFDRDRLDGLFGHPPGPAPRFADSWAARVVAWVTEQTPRAFGYLRSRWCCALLAAVLWRAYELDVSRETVRRWLHAAGIVWRRPRPVLRRRDPERETILEGLRALLRELPEDETVVFQDEADLDLNPEVGRMWMRRGAQAVVPTPGDNEKNYLAGALHVRTGVLLGAVTGPKRDGPLFVRHLGELCRRLRRYRVIHVVCDNARFHRPERCRRVRDYLAGCGGRVVLHFLPRYAPECNPAERVWWHMREELTRNHQCRSLGELIDLVFAWLGSRKRFVVEDAVYHDEAPAEGALDNAA